MKLEHQVCTPFQAKKLKQVGVIQESLFAWCGDAVVRIPKDFDSILEEQFAAAFTVAELGNMLVIPKSLRTPGGYSIAYSYDEWVITKDNAPYSGRRPFKYEAQARAELLLIFIQEKIVTVEQANKRLAS